MALFKFGRLKINCQTAKLNKPPIILCIRYIMLTPVISLFLKLHLDSWTMIAHYNATFILYAHSFTIFIMVLIACDCGFKLWCLFFLFIIIALKWILIALIAGHKLYCSKTAFQSAHAKCYINLYNYVYILM